MLLFINIQIFLFDAQWIYYLEDKELPEEDVAPGDPDLDGLLPAPVPPVGSDSGRPSLQVDRLPSKIGKYIDIEKNQKVYWKRALVPHEVKIYFLNI